MTVIQNIALVLRWYQQECVDRVATLIREGIKRIMIVSPAGSGKGSVIAYLAAHAAMKNNRVLIMVHRKELVLDLAQRIKEHYSVECGIIMDKYKQDLGKTIQVGSVMSIIRRDIGEYDVLISDECHHIVSDSQKSILEKTKPEYIFGFTATPTRSDDKRFDTVFEKIIQLSTYRELMKEKYLVPTRVFTPEGLSAYEGVKLRVREYIQGDLEVAYMKQRLYSGLYKVWKELSDGKSTMIFNVRKKHNFEVYQYFKDQGESVAYLDDSTKPRERDKIVRDFKAGKILIVCSIFTLTEGVDIPICKTVILNYATLVVGRYIQSACRGSRPMFDKGAWKETNGIAEKDSVLIIDCGGNTHRHGRVEDFDMFGFDLSGKRPKLPAPTKTCPECSNVVYASSRICKFCGHLFPIKSIEDDKKMIDEVVFKEFKAEHSLEWKILQMTFKKLQNCPVEWIRIIAIIKAYKPGWVRRVLVAREEKEYVFPVNQKGYIKMYSKLRSIEIEKGTYETYLSLKQMYGK